MVDLKILALRLGAGGFHIFISCLYRLSSSKSSIPIENSVETLSIEFLVWLSNFDCNTKVSQSLENYTSRESGFQFLTMFRQADPVQLFFHNMMSNYFMST